ncbi:hypothetical protein GH714_033972 [Hevea brasiliensis]|uniref:Rx N-terminal domain-containing protein n=1 Tax=Hevea brasiliensis TaxID=3981 RepID=A0A6A6M3U8_HEVBR|nr:hypothetical protein GH714_033972 [Hevea brasiliensis]
MPIESLAFNVTEKFLEKLASHAYQEISFAWGLQGELKKLEDILLTVKAVLLDAEEKQVDNHQLRVWLIKLKDALYDAEDVFDDFECETQRKRVLKLYGTTIQKEIIKCTNSAENLSEKGMEQLQSILRERIRDKKYLLILDDVWNDDPMKWDPLKELLCVGANGSKIVVTTRSKKVASIMGTISEPYELSGLPHDKCVALFTRCAFKEGEEKHYPNLLKIGDEIVKKCKGVPLAVKTLASLLLTNKEESYWKFIRDTITSTTTHISKSVRHLLFPDFTSLPHGLSTLLQDLERVRTALFMSEEISQSALDLCLSRLKYLRMLDLSESQLEVPLERIGSLKHLRLLFLPEIKKVPNSICKLQNLQSLLLQTEELPNDIRYLISLRFLSFSTKQKCLAKNGLGCLTSLRFLWIVGCENLEYLCEDMQGLKHLRTLIITGCESLISLPQSMKYLTALETLRIEYCENLNLTMEEGKADQDLARFNLQRLILKKLPKLVEFPEWLLRGSTNTLQLLKLDWCRNLKELPACLQNTVSLQQIVIECCDKLSQRCERGEGEDWSKIAHIPKIVLDGSEINSTDDSHIDSTSED